MYKNVERSLVQNIHYFVVTLNELKSDIVICRSLYRGNENKMPNFFA